ncbi:MFS transporter [Halorussus limi]|uniref:MFS transporter n=1 Tax=Halorussus limi TaxID=2938695 RepID=A0A8U0HVS4_9EURY|nr:MFS transporter [Halorussus limi]UPV74811.1 MFS transporter [Halorussus limi]
MNDLRRAVLTYYAYRCVSAIGFVAPFLNVFLVNRGVTFTDLALGGSAMAAVTLLGEVPSGYVGDRLGRRWSLLLSQSLFAVGISSWFFARSTAPIVAVFVVTGLGAAFQSGSTQAWLYDVLDEEGAADRYADVESRGSALRLWVTATTMVAGGLLYVLDPRVPFVCAAALSWSGVGIVASLPRNARYRGGDGEASDSGDDADDPLGPRRALAVVRRFLARPDLRAVVAVVAVYAGASVAAGDYLQPVVVGVLPRTTAAVAGVALPEFVVLGCLYAAFTALSAAAVDRAGALRDALGATPALLALVGLGGTAMAVPVVATRALGGPVAVGATLAAVVGFRTCREVVHPIHSAYLNDRAESVGRATTLSAVSFVSALVRVPFLLVGGRVADATTPALALALVGLVAVVAVLGAAVTAHPLDSETAVTGPVEE